MKKKAAEKAGKQEVSHAMSVAFGQLVLPMMLASEAIKKGLLAFVQQLGLLAFTSMLEAEAEQIAGPKGKHAKDRTHHHWGTARTPLPFGGRQVVVERPRVRRKGKGGGEVELPSVAAARETDPMPEHVAEQVVAGVSTRGYERALEPVAESVETRGESKSQVSRALIENTSDKLAEFLARKLDELELAAMFIDGIEIAKHAVIVALGVNKDGTKVPLGVWCGSTENHVVTTELLQNLLERGLRVDRPLLFVIDGGKGIRKALTDVFGDRAIVQRCQVHKTRNVLDHLPDERRTYVRRQMRDAYKSKSAKTAKALLGQLASWLEANGEDSAAASLREGLDETLTVLRLGLPTTLCRTFSTTNAIENMNGTLRRVLRNVKRWRGEDMIKRWVALGVAEAERGFRRVKGHAQMNLLLAALASLRPKTGLAEERKAA
ncbi:MAG: IS256 family transposase [Byssovorax sp.]